MDNQIIKDLWEQLEKTQEKLYEVELEKKSMKKKITKIDVPLEKYNNLIKCLGDFVGWENGAPLLLMAGVLKEIQKWGKSNGTEIYIQLGEQDKKNDSKAEDN